MSNPLTPERLAALRALCRAATQGARQQGRLLSTPDTRRWTAEQRERVDANERRLVFVGFTAADAGRSRHRIAEAREEADAAHIAAFDPTTCEALLDAADDLARVREALERVHHEGCTSAGCDTIGPPERHEHSLCCPVGIARHLDAALVGGKE